LPIGATPIKNDFGDLGYGGACPPQGDKPHRYVFTIYALKTAKLELPINASAALSSYMIKANAIGKASLTIYK
jgi:Raf kinase inhibitor-like YbhB/YbcL family protein